MLPVIQDMILQIYHDVILAGWVTALILGICLIAVRVPDRPVYKAYIRSRRILGVAYIIFGVAIAQFSFFNLRQSAPEIAIALPLSYYYLEGILFGMSFCSLLDSRYINRRQLTADFGLYTIYLLILWSNALFLEDGPLRKAIFILAAAWFFIAAANISLRFLRIYANAVGKINNYYVEDIAAFVRWLHKSTYAIIFCGLCGSVLSFAPPWGNSIFMLAGIILFIYIFVSMQNYILNFENIETAVDYVSDPAETDSANNSSNAAESILQPRIDLWIENQGYLTPGITLGDLTTAVASNRSYVSAYINSRYGCNFREWINGLRLGFAKTQLTEHPRMTIEKISCNAGFSSSAYFCRLFARHEGMTPSAWRELNTPRSSGSDSAR